MCPVQTVTYVSGRSLLNQLRWSVFLVQSSPTIQQPSLHIHAANRQEHDCKCRVSRSGLPAFNHALPWPGYSANRLADEQIGYRSGKELSSCFRDANILAIGTRTQQYGERSTDLDSILLDSTTEFLLEASGRGA